MSLPTLDPAGYRYRPLKQGLNGWDVYALQSALPGLAKDGDFGPRTDAAVRDFQRTSKLTIDGIAGVVTQRALAVACVWPVQADQDTPAGLIRGQLEHESSFWLGNHSIRYANGSFDMGVAQINRPPTDPEERFCFDVTQAVAYLGTWLRSHHNAYYGKPGAQTHQRAWELASASWNRPAWTDKLAAGGQLTPSQQQTVDAYIEAATVYVTAWTP